MAQHLQLGVSLAGLIDSPRAPWAGGPRSAIAWAADTGFASVQIDAAGPGLRPRELDRSARRDLASLLRRDGLSLSGLDLWIPAPHFGDPARAERALDASLGALGLAADLASLMGDPGAAVLALTFPADGEAAQRIGQEAEFRGVRVADYTIAKRGSEGRGVPVSPGVGIDPAAALLRGMDPATAVLEARDRLVQARLSDASDLGRAPVGAGRLDLHAYVASLVAAGYPRPVVLDLRALPDPAAAVQAAFSAWPASGSVK